VLGFQGLAGLLLVGLTAALTRQSSLIASVAWGVLAVWVPALVFARALSRQMRRQGVGSALVGFFVWELVKVVLTVALLVVAPKVVANLDWAALVVGFVVTLKMYWLVMVLNMSKHRRLPPV
jgi:ATP synthase protein I